MFQDDAAAGSDFVKKVLDNLKASTDTEGAVAESDLVLEAIIENLKIKQDLFARLDKVNITFIYDMYQISLSIVGEWTFLIK